MNAHQIRDLMRDLRAEYRSAKAENRVRDMRKIGHKYQVALNALRVVQEREENLG